jgi:hypothetical protein
LPRVTDAAFLARVNALAERMQVPPPLVRLWPSITGHQQAFAFAGTIQAPQLVVTDGILRRLSPDECDSIVAHELAHIANGSLWVLASVFPMGSTVATLMTALAPPALAVPFGIAFMVGLRRIVSRRYEFDCDYRAARAIGFRTTISALAKIHAVNPIRNSGWLARLVFATATHPARDVRLDALTRRAPPDDRADEIWEESTIRSYHRFAVAALVLWIGVLSSSLIGAWQGVSATWLAIPLCIVALAPYSLLWLALRRYMSIRRRRHGKYWVSLKLLAFGGGTAILVAAFSSAIISMVRAETPQGNALLPTLLVSVLSNGIVFGGLIAFAVTHRKRKLQRDVAVAMQVHDFERACELCRAAPNVVRRSHLLRHNQALAEAICGNREEAISLLERLCQDKPRFPASQLVLSELYLDTNQPDRALELALRVAPRLPGDPGLPLFEARVLRRLRRLDEAQAACDRALVLDPESGSIQAAAAVLAADRGEFDKAQSLLEKAFAMAPGDAYLLVVAADIALQRDQLEEAAAALERAREAVRTNPLVFLEAELARLDGALADRLHPVVTENIFLE